MAKSIWESLFSSVDATRGDVSNLRDELYELTDTTGITRAVGRIEGRLDRMELALDALVELLTTKKVITSAELALTVQRVDLADGKEDGRIGPMLTKDAPPCPRCALPLNPTRELCLYCGHKFTQAELRGPAPEPPTIACERCSTVVQERTTWITEQGVVCTDCYHGRAPTGGLSVADEGDSGALSVADDAGGLSLDDG